MIRGQHQRQGYGLREQGVREIEFGSQLSIREFEILALIAKGWSAKEVARNCGITPRTVESHLDAVRIKLRARNRTHMVAIALSSTLLPPLVGELDAA